MVITGGPKSTNVSKLITIPDNGVYHNSTKINRAGPASRETVHDVEGCNIHSHNLGWLSHYLLADSLIKELRSLNLSLCKKY